MNGLALRKHWLHLFQHITSSFQSLLDECLNNKLRHKPYPGQLSSNPLLNCAFSRFRDQSAQLSLFFFSSCFIHPSYQEVFSNNPMDIRVTQSSQLLLRFLD